MAAEAKVSASTVSRSLNEDPQIPDETRKRVVEVARRLGYEKSASVSALMRSFRRGNSRRHRDTIAFLVEDSPDAWNQPGLEFYNRILRGLRDRAGNLGYQVDVFWLRAPGRSLARLGSILKARGIRGVILAPLSARATLDGFPWENFASITIGYMLQRPRLHRVQTDMYENMSEILSRFAAQGFRRIGFVTNSQVEQRLGRLAAARFSIHQEEIPVEERIPVLKSDHDPDPAVKRWLERNRPDAVVSQVDYVRPQVLAARRRDGGAPGFAWLAAQLNEPEIPGMVPLHETIAAASLDLLASLVAHGDIGVPVEPRSVLIPGRWRDGAAPS